MMNIIDDWLAPSNPGVKFSESENITPNASINPKFVCVYSTQTYTFGELEEFQDFYKLSYHVVVDENGTIIQQCGFTEKAWHAGTSYWQGYHGLNSYAIGIAVVNPCSVLHFPYDDAGREMQPPYDSAEDWVLFDGRYWFKYQHAQIAALDRLLPSLVVKYNIRDIVRHSDVSRGKDSPGPLFPINRYKRFVDLGNSDSGGRYVVVSKGSVAVHGGPDVRFDPVGKITYGTTVKVLRAEGDWRMLVPVHSEAQPVDRDVQGWVHESSLRRL